MMKIIFNALMVLRGWFNTLACCQLLDSGFNCDDDDQDQNAARMLQPFGCLSIMIPIESFFASVAIGVANQILSIDCWWGEVEENDDD